MVSKRILLLDNFDSFTHILADYFLQQRSNLIVLRNTISISEIAKGQYDGIVLSPGPGRPEKSGVMMELIAQYHDKLPILGICLGHQALGEFFGAQLVKAIKPMHGKISEIYLQEDPIFEGIPSKIEAVRYHSLVLDQLPDCLKILAETKEKEIMLIKHHIHPCYGIQFHPEAALSQFGLKLIGNWLNKYELLG